MSPVILAVLAVPREGGNATLIFMMQMAAIFAIFYFLLIRPQRKEQERHRTMIEQLKKGDEMIRETDRLLAEAIEIIAGLYKDGVLAKPKAYAYAYPDLLTFHDAPTPVEQKLFVMHLEHRMRAFQGTFHANPDYALWYGWSEMQRDLTEIRFMAKEMREKHESAKVPARPMRKKR